MFVVSVEHTFGSISIRFPALRFPHLKPRAFAVSLAAPQSWGMDLQETQRAKSEKPYLEGTTPASVAAPPRRRQHRGAWDGSGARGRGKTHFFTDMDPVGTPVSTSSPTRGFHPSFPHFSTLFHPGLFQASNRTFWTRGGNGKFLKNLKFSKDRNFLPCEDCLPVRVCACAFDFDGFQRLPQSGPER